MLVLFINKIKSILYIENMFFKFEKIKGMFDLFVLLPYLLLTILVIYIQTPLNNPSRKFWLIVTVIIFVIYLFLTFIKAPEDD